jgi:hypothetical protein
MSRLQNLETFVERAESARQQGHGMALFDEHQLAREEVLHVHKLRVAAND